jgi:hypothetical protein
MKAETRTATRTIVPLWAVAIAVTIISLLVIVPR